MSDLPDGFVLASDLPSGFVPITEQPKQTATPISKDLAIGAGALGAGLIGAKAAQFATAPIREMSPIQRQLDQIAKQASPNLPIATEDIPEVLSSTRTAKVASMYKPADITKDLAVKKADIGIARTNFLNKTANKVADDIAQHVADNYKEFTNSAYNHYGNVLKQAEKSVGGRTLVANGARQAVFHKTIMDAVADGVPVDSLKQLQSIADAFDNNNAMKFKDIKSAYTSAINSAPESIRPALQKNWGRYLSEYASPKIQGMLAEENAKYENFTKVRGGLFKLIDRRTESFDTKKFSSRLKSFIRSGDDAGVTSLLNELSNGGDIYKPIKGLKGKVDTLIATAGKAGEFAKAERDVDVIAQQHQVLKAKHAEDIAKINAEYAAKVDQAQKLLSAEKQVTKKYPFRSRITNPSLLVKDLKGAAMMAGKVGGGVLRGLPLGAIQGVGERGAMGGVDFPQALGAFSTGMFGSSQQKEQAAKEAFRQWQEASAI